MGGGAETGSAAMGGSSSVGVGAAGVASGSVGGVSSGVAVGVAQGLAADNPARPIGPWTYSLRGVYFNKNAYDNTTDCLNAAAGQRLPLDLCR